MGKCFNCGEEVELAYGYVDPNLHKWCQDEYNRRVNDKNCVFCDQPLDAEALEANDIKHEGCAAAGIMTGYGAVR